MHKNEQEVKQKLMQLIRDAIAKDQALRDQYGIGDKFRFIREKLTSLLSYVEEEIKITALAAEKELVILPDELLVHVYLFNSQGISLASWRKMVHESVLYEYSINRPIYLEKSQVDALIRSRSNKLQHGYLSVIVKKSDVIDNKLSKDAMGNALVKVKEGSLKRDKILTFTHGDNEYRVTQDGEFISSSKNT